MSDSPSRQKRYVDFLLVYLLLFVSGSWRYNLLGDKALIAVFLVSLVVWYLYSDRKINDRFLLYVVVFTSMLLALRLYTEGSLSLASIIASTIKLVLAYLIVKTVGRRFVDTYLKLIVFLAAISLLGYATDRFNLFDGIVRRLPPVGEMGYEGFFYVFRFPWHISRNNGIFFEPGAYQIFLNFALFLLFFFKVGFTEKKKWIYIGILTTTLITTFSTTGFMIFIVLLVMFFIRSELLGRPQKFILFGLSFLVVILLSAQFYSTLVVKIDAYLNANEYDFGYSAQNRSADAKTDLKVFRKHIFGLGYDDYFKEFGILGRVGDERGYSSNGVTKMLAVYGLPFSLFIFGSYYWAIRRMLTEFLFTAGAFIMFMLFLASESAYMMSPFCFSIIAAPFVIKGASFLEKKQPENGSRI